LYGPINVKYVFLVVFVSLLLLLLDLS